MQEPSVLIRVSGKTRDQLNALRKPAGEYSWNRKLESIGAVVARLAEAETGRSAPRKEDGAGSGKGKARRRAG